MPFLFTEHAEDAERCWMTLDACRYRRTCNQSSVLVERDPLIRDRDNDLERAPWSVFRLRLLRGIRFRVPVLVLVPELVIIPSKWPEKGPGVRRRPCRKHANGECRHE